MFLRNLELVSPFSERYFAQDAWLRRSTLTQLPTLFVKTNSELFRKGPKNLNTSGRLHKVIATSPFAVFHLA